MATGNLVRVELEEQRCLIEEQRIEIQRQRHRLEMQGRLIAHIQAELDALTTTPRPAAVNSQKHLQRRHSNGNGQPAAVSDRTRL